MKLSEGVKGNSYRIKEIMYEKGIKLRLIALGLTKDTPVFIETNDKGPMIIKVRGSKIAIGRRICEGIIVREM